jgi:hypothetical protein
MPIRLIIQEVCCHQAQLIGAEWCSSKHCRVPTVSFMSPIIWERVNMVMTYNKCNKPEVSINSIQRYRRLTLVFRKFLVLCTPMSNHVLLR